jgi:hypothetical protein
MASEDWTEIDPNTELSATTRQMYEQAKSIYKQYKAARDMFEGAMQDEHAGALPAGSELKFGYKFGKLSIAIGPKRERVKATAKQRPSLTEWLRAQQAASART